MLTIPDLSEKSMEIIFSSILGGFLADGGSKDLEKLALPIVKSSVNIYTTIRK